MAVHSLPGQIVKIKQHRTLIKPGTTLAAVLGEFTVKLEDKPTRHGRGCLCAWTCSGPCDCGHADPLEPSPSGACNGDPQGAGCFCRLGGKSYIEKIWRSPGSRGVSSRSLSCTLAQSVS